MNGSFSPAETGIFAQSVSRVRIIGPGTIQQVVGSGVSFSMVSTEFTPGLPVPAGLADLVIYELHVGSLGFGGATPGDLSDAIAFLNHSGRSRRERH